MNFKQRIIKFLRWTEQYTNTDMVYLAKGSFWHIFERIIVFIIGFATMSVLSRWLSKQTFGTYQYILSVTAILGLSTLSMGTALVRAISKKREGMLIEVLKEEMRWSTLGILTSLSISGWYLWQGNSLLGYSFLMVSFLFPWQRYFNIYTSFWRGRKRFDVNARHTILINFLEAIAFLPVIYFTNNLFLILSAYFLSRSVFRAIAFKIALNNTQNNKKDKETISYGRHLSVIEVASTVANKIDNVLIWQFLGPVQVAIYTFAKKPVTRLKGTIPISTLALPKLSEGNKSTDKLLKKFFKMFLLSIPLALAAAAVMPYLYKFVFPDYLEAIPYAQALTVIIALTPFSLLSSSLKAEMKKRELYIIKIASPLLKIALFVILIPLYQVWGVILAMIGTSFIKSGLTFYFFKKS